MKRTFLLLLSITVSHISMAQFTANNLVVARAQSTTNTTAGSIALIEYKTDGTVVGTPTIVGADNFYVGYSASTLADGMLSLSSDGKFLTMYGYSVLAPSNDNIQSTTATFSPRSLAVVNINKAQHLIPIASIHDATAARSSFAQFLTTDSYGVYLGGGKTNANGALQYITLNSADFTVSAANPVSNVNTKSVKIFNNQLYNSASVGSNRFNAVGAGIPTTAGQTASNSSPVNDLANPGDFVFFGKSLLYVADETATTGGIYKYSSADNGVTWTARGKVNSAIAGDLLFRGLTGRLEDGKVTLYGVTTIAKENSIVKIVDKTAANVAISNATTDVTLTTLATATSTSGFRGIAFTPNSTVTLPIALDNFSAKNVNGEVELNWSTASEQNNKGFEVQHSTDGQIFITIGEVKGNNNSTQKNTYSFKDKGAVAGTNYYQLKQIDNNGDFKIYGPKAVSISFSKDELSVFANSSSVQIKLNSSVAISDVSVTVLNTKGQTVASIINTQIIKGINSIQFPVALTSGVYVLNIQGSGLNEVKKFVANN